MSGRDSASDTNDRLTGYFSKHLVPILLTLEKDGKSCEYVITAFVLSVHEQWFLVTAGHWLKKIKRLIDSGYQIASCHFLDALGLDARYPEPIPCDWERLSWEEVFDGIVDYGVAVLSLYYRGLFEKNGVQALNEDVWRAPPSDPKSCSYWLLGVPAELVDRNAKGIKIVVTFHLVEPIAERPQTFTETDAPLLYGRVAVGAGVNSIKGMSGGPIFALKETDAGLWYWLVALQSRWTPESHYIAACPTQVLGEAIERVFEESGT